MPSSLPKVFDRMIGQWQFPLTGPGQGVGDACGQVPLRAPAEQVPPQPHGQLSIVSDNIMPA